MSRRGAGASLVPPPVAWSLAAVTWDPVTLQAGVAAGTDSGAALLPVPPQVPVAPPAPPAAAKPLPACTYGLGSELCCVAGCEATADTASNYVRWPCSRRQAYLLGWDRPPRLHPTI